MPVVGARAQSRSQSRLCLALLAVIAFVSVNVRAVGRELARAANGQVRHESSPRGQEKGVFSQDVDSEQANETTGRGFVL